jgi:two-component system response regulator MprA
MQERNLMNKTDNKRILVVDDDPGITSFLKRGLVFEGYSVETAGDGIEALSKIRAAEPDIVILDVMMPGIGGIEVSQRLRQLSSTPILMLTAKGTLADKVAGLNGGADDYLVKPFEFDELLARIKALLRRSDPTRQESLRFQDLEMNTSTREVKRGSELVDLTAQEFDLLEYLMRNPKQVLTREQIYNKVWGYDFEGESNVIEVYIRYLRSKLEPGGRPKLIHTVRGVGYVLKE